MRATTVCLRWGESLKVKKLLEDGRSEAAEFAHPA